MEGRQLSSLGGQVHANLGSRTKPWSKDVSLTKVTLLLTLQLTKYFETFDFCKYYISGYIKLIHILSCILLTMSINFIFKYKLITLCMTVTSTGASLN